MEEKPQFDLGTEPGRVAQTVQVPEAAQPEPARKPFYTHPRFSLATGIATLVSVPLAIYLAFASVRKPGLTYYLHPVRTKIVALERDSRLQVAYDGQDIKGNVTALQFALWNAGDEPIRRADVLDHIRFQTTVNARILHAELRQVSRPVTGLSLDESRKDLGIVVIDWTILEKDDGAAIQVLFEGDPDAAFLLSGTVVNQANLRVRKASVAAPNSEEAFREQKRKRWILIIMGAVSGAMLIFSAVVSLRLRRLRNRGSRLPFVLMVLAGAAALLVAAVYIWIVRGDYFIPFSF